MNKIMELADAYAEAKVAAAISVQIFGKYSQQSQHRVDAHKEARAALVAEVERVEAEIEAVRKANLDCVDHFNQMRDELEAAKKDATRLSQAGYSLTAELCWDSFQKKWLRTHSAWECDGLDLHVKKRHCTGER